MKSVALKVNLVELCNVYFCCCGGTLWRVTSDSSKTGSDFELCIHSILILYSEIFFMTLHVDTLRAGKSSLVMRRRLFRLRVLVVYEKAKKRS